MKRENKHPGQRKERPKTADDFKGLIRHQIKNIQECPDGYGGGTAIDITFNDNSMLCIEGDIRFLSPYQCHHEDEHLKSVPHPVQNKWRIWVCTKCDACWVD